MINLSKNMRALELATKYKTLLNNYAINTPLRLSHFFAQLDHESGLKPIGENLNYSEGGLLRIFSKYFTPITAKQYARKPKAIANRVYANRMGNGSETSGDGWKYRGRGFIQITGKSNYLVLSKDTRIDYINNPDWLLRDADAMISALWFWQKNNLNRFSDKDDVRGLNRAINGGFNGLDHRIELTNEYKKVFK
jgi:putative chitinase